MAQKLPQGQKRLTNIAIVKFRSHGKRFEIACYKNKVLNWREGIEKELDEVIQTDTIFENVSKGVWAKEKDLMKVFGTTNNEDICKKILKTGDLQVSDKERDVHLEELFRDIVQVAVDRCVHPQTGRQLTASALEDALKKVGFSVQPDIPAKRQGLTAIQTLCREFPESFTRAKMRLRITMPDRLRGEIRTHLVEEVHALIELDLVDGGSASAAECAAVGVAAGPASGSCSLTFLCEPSHYRQLDRLATVTYASDGVVLQVITNTVVSEGIGSLTGNVGVANAPAAQSSAATGVMAASSREAACPQPASSAAPTGGYPAAAAPAKAAVKLAAPAKKGGMRCSACVTEFEEAVAYRAHCKSDWHNFNLKRKVKSLAPVSEEEFAEISLDIKEGFLAVD